MPQESVANLNYSEEMYFIISYLDHFHYLIIEAEWRIYASVN